MSEKQENFTFEPVFLEKRLTIYGNPISKKNSMRLVPVNGRIIPLPSKQYVEYEKEALKQLSFQYNDEPIDYEVNISCLYFMQTKRKCDLVNLLEATLDVLVKAKIIADDNHTIVAKHDGCYVTYDKENPRVEIVIKELCPFEV